GQRGRPPPPRKHQNPRCDTGFSYRLQLPTEGTAMAEPQPIHILSVEDHPVVREGLSRILGSQPDMLLVAQAGNAEEALAEFRRHRPDITLMDLRLPGTN